MWSVGSGPFPARLVKFSATTTMNESDLYRHRHDGIEHTVRDNDIVGSIHINRLIERESYITVRDRRIRRCVELCDRCLCEARNEFLDVAYALRCRSRIARTYAVPEAEVYR